jgi:hypothetical protein
MKKVLMTPEEYKEFYEKQMHKHSQWEESKDDQ